MHTRRLLTLLLVLTLFTTAATAYEASGGYVEIPANRTVDELSVSAGTVVVRGTVEGDAQLFASDVTITGPIRGDLQIAAANTLLRGPVTGDVSVFSGNLRLGNRSRIGGDLRAFAGTITLGGRINGSVQAASSVLSLAPGTVVAGNLTYGSDSFRNQGTVQGRIIREDDEDRSAVPIDLGAIIGFGSQLVLGAVMLLLVGGFTGRAVDASEDRAAWKALVGFGFAIAVPLVLLMLSLTIIGIPLAVLGIFLYGAVLGLGSIIGTLVIGRQITARIGSGSLYAALLTGSIAVLILRALPVVGTVLWIFVSLLGTGGLLYALIALRGDADGD